MRTKCGTYHICLSAFLFTVATFMPSFTIVEPSNPAPIASLASGMKIESIYDIPEFLQKTDSVIIPLKRAGRLFLIEATVDGESGNFVFDSGANGLVLNSTYFRGHVKWGGKASSGVTGSVGIVDQVTVERLEFSDLKYSGLVADLANLGHIENRRGVKILGLLGFSLLRSMEIVFDPVNSELKLFRIDKSGKRVNAKSMRFRSEYVAKIEGSSNVLFLKGNIKERILNFCIDTGAETNALSSDLNKKVMSTITITRRAVLKGVGGSNSEVLFGRMNEFSVGPRKFSGMETVITNLDALSEAYGTHIDGMLGFSFLEHGVFCINFLSGQFGMRFTKGEDK